MRVSRRRTARSRRRLLGPPHSFDRKLIAPMVLGSILNPINSSIIAVSLVPIGLAFGASPSSTAWLVSALYLATAIGQPVMGRLVDTYGPRPLYLVGTALTGVAGILGTLAPSLGFLVVARVVLGIGTCAGYPAAMRLIRREADRTGRTSPASILTLLSVASQTVVVIGPTLGGVLIGLAGWRATFAINIPLSIACLVMGSRRLPRDLSSAKDPGASGDGAAGTEGRSRGVATGEPARPGPASLDYLGMVLFAGSLVTLLLLLMEPSAGHWPLAVAAVALVSGFAAWELRVADPFLDLRVFGGNGPLLATYGRSLLAATVSYCFLYGFTQWLEEGRGLSAASAGLVLLPMSVVSIAVASLTGRRDAIRAKLLVGSSAQVVACGILLTLSGASPVLALVAATVVMGVPQGLLNLANQSAVYHQADPVRLGASAGLLRTSVYLGAVVASAAVGRFLQPSATTAGMHDLTVFMGVTAALLLVAALVDRSIRTRKSLPPKEIS